jgi:hypothetical protein
MRVQLRRLVPVGELREIAAQFGHDLNSAVPAFDESGRDRRQGLVTALLGGSRWLRKT